MTTNNAAEGQNCMLVKLILFYRNSGDWMFGGRGGWSTEFCSAALPKLQFLAAIEMAMCERLCIPVYGNKMAEVKETFLGFFQLLHFKNGVWTNGT